MIVCPADESYPSPFWEVTIVEKKLEKTYLDEQVCKPTEVEYVPDKDLDVDAHLDERLSILQPLFIAHKWKNDPKIYSGQIFQTKVKCLEHVCSLGMDTRSCTDFITE